MLPVASGDGGVWDGGLDAPVEVADSAGGSGGAVEDTGWPPQDGDPLETASNDGPDETNGGEAGAGGSPVTDTVRPTGALDGDGFLASPPLCGDAVWDYYQQSSYKALHVGRDEPCGSVSTYRAFLQFSLAPFAGTTISAALLRFELRTKSNPRAGVVLHAIESFGNLTLASWNQAVLQDYGPVLDEASAMGWIEVDVTDRVTQALGSGVIAFRLSYATESENPEGKSRWYGITAVDDGDARAPQLVITYLP